MDQYEFLFYRILINPKAIENGHRLYRNAYFLKAGITIIYMYYKTHANCEYDKPYLNYWWRHSLKEFNALLDGDKDSERTLNFNKNRNKIQIYDIF